MANLNLYSARDLGDDAWNAYMQYKSQVFMSLAKDQAEYIIAIEKLVREDAPSYRGEIIDKDTGVTDFDYLRDQLTRAKEIYCMGIPCTDPGQDGPAQLIGMLDRNFNKIYDIHLNTQDWIEQAAGEGGWMKRIALAQSKFGGKEGTEDASVVFNALVKFREEKDGMLRADAAKSLDGHIEYLGEWSDMQAQIKMFDLPNAEGIYDDQTLNYISPNEPGYEENMLLFKAIERMKVGDVVKAEEYHDLWTKGYPERKRQDAVETRRKDKVVTDFGIAQDAIIEKAWTDHDTNVRGSIEALDGLQSQVKDGRGFHKDFTGSVQWYMPAINWDKGSLNMETVTERKAYVSDNLSYWMDNNAWGDAYDDWQKAVDHSYKVNVKPDSKEPLFGDEIMKRLALEYYFLNMDESDVLKLAQGGQGLPWVAPFMKGKDTFFGLGELLEREGMDFPGKGFGENTPEEAAEDYFVQTWKVWDALNSAEYDPVLQSSPEGLAPKNLHDPDNIVGSNANPANPPQDPDKRYIRNEDVPAYNAFIDSLDALANDRVPPGHIMMNDELMKVDTVRTQSDTTIVNPGSLGTIMGDSTAIDTDVPGNKVSKLDYGFVSSILDKPGGKDILRNMNLEIMQFVQNNPDSFPGNEEAEARMILNDWSSLTDSLREAYGKGAKEGTSSPLADFIISNYINTGE